MTSVEDFPEIEFASEEGLLALGGDLSPQRLLSAYRKGIFPWYNPGEPILWWSPDPRCVLFPDQYKPKRSLKKAIRKHQFSFSFDQAFEDVIKQCAFPRARGPGTWITKDMMDAYIQLHHLGYAHSVETWKDNCLAGGLYGIALDGMFYGESMFTNISNASKAALDYLIANLIDWNFQLIDCQITSPHLVSLGAVEIPRAEFIKRLECAFTHSGKPGTWKNIKLENLNNNF